MNVLSLFDGISCGQVALERAGIAYDNYYASEIESAPIRITQRNYLNTQQLGDVTRWQEWDIDWSSIDLVIGGSPCQGFSFAGEQLAFDDPRSRLFFVYRDIVRHVLRKNPRARWLLENVKMSARNENIISREMWARPRLINSSLVSAQNRTRLYWANFEFTAPQPKGITLGSILEDGWWAPRTKSYCITANYYKGSDFRRYFYKSAKQIVLRNGFDPRSEMTYENAHEIARNNRDKWRTLTPTECERAFTLPVGYTEGENKTNRYKAMGNGWTVDVITHILSHLLK